MSTSHSLRVNTSVIHDVISREAILVNLVNGRYYSLDKAGVDVWNLIERGTTVGQLVEAIAQKYAGSRVEIEDGVNNLLVQLQEEHLVFKDESVAEEEDEALADAPSSVDVPILPPFQAPVLQTYTDMEALLLLDPIHDVDEGGWPHAKPGQSEA